MIIIDAPQGSPDWIRARLGRLTASRMSEIITPTRKPSASRDRLLADLLHEWASGMPSQDFEGPWMERGSDLEDEAIGAFEFDRDCHVQRVGFCAIEPDDGSPYLIGCSPDGLIGEDAGLEIKCPAGPKHVQNLLAAQGGGVPKQYVAQVQGGLWVTGRPIWLFVSYCPGYPSAVVEVERDDEYIATLAELAEAFTDDLMRARARLLDMGVEPVTHGA